MWTESDLTPLTDALSFIRAKPKMFLVPGEVGVDLAQRLIAEALVLGATSTVCIRRDGWYVLSADIDWLNAPCRFQVPMAELFRRIVAFPEAGDNSMRAEVLTVAFSDAVFTATPDSQDLIAGSSPPAQVLEAMLPSGTLRSLAFRPIANPLTCPGASGSSDIAHP